MTNIPDIDKAGLRNFAFIMAVMIAGIFALLLPWLSGFQFPYWPWGLALLLVSWGLTAPATIEPLYRAWMRFGLLMSRITTPIILGLLFFLILTPVGWLMRALKAKSTTLTLDNSGASYRVPSTERAREDMEKPF